MDFSKLLCFYHPLSNKTELTFDQNLKALKVLNASGPLYLWQCFMLWSFFTVNMHSIHCIVSCQSCSCHRFLFSHRHRNCHRHHHMYLEKRVGKYSVARSLYCSQGKTSAGQRQHSSHLKQSSLEFQFSKGFSIHYLVF